MALKRKILGALLVLIGALGLSRPGMAHLDPPGPPAFQEVIWLITVAVADDMDIFGAGEMWISWTVTQGGHAGAAGRIPPAGTVAVNAPPIVPFPGPFPVVIYNHLNCWPPERPFQIDLVLNDDDLFGVDSSPLNLLVGAPVGVFGAANAEFGFGVVIGIFPTPQFDALCRAGLPIPGAQQPSVPPPPATPSTGPTPSPELPPLPEPEMPGIDDLTQLLTPVEPLERRQDDILVIGLVIGFVAGALLGLILGRVWRRKKRRRGV